MGKKVRKISSIMLVLVILFTLSLSYSYADFGLSKYSQYHIIINTKTNKLGYFKDKKLVKEFKIATGKSNTPTPTGKSKIVNKIKNRPYYSGGIPGGDPRNPLGDRWLGLQLNGTYGTTYAIHGNNDASSIGKHISNGCIRMYNEEVRWLFNQVPVGTTVILDKSDKSFVDIAKKYNIILSSGSSTDNFKQLTNDIYRNDAGSGKYLTYINGKGYSQYSYVTSNGKYAFTPSSWMEYAGLNVVKPTSSNGYKMTITNPYKKMLDEAEIILDKVKQGKIDTDDLNNELNRISNELEYQMEIISVKNLPKRELTKDIYKYDAGKGKYLTYINGKGYSQYSYLNASGKYAFTPSSWMVAAGLEVTMPTSSNGYTMKINNPYKKSYDNIIIEIQSYI